MSTLNLPDFQTPPATRTRRSHAERRETTRTQLLDAAMAVVQARGYQGATVFEVAKQAGVTPGALQHHFGTKTGLLQAVVDELVARNAAPHMAWPDPALPLAERAQQFVQALWQQVYAPERFLVAWQVYLGCVGDPELAAYIQHRRKDLEGLLHSRSRAVFPELDGQADADAFVDLLLSSLRGLGLSCRFGPTESVVQGQLQQLVRLLVLRCQHPG